LLSAEFFLSWVLFKRGEAKAAQKSAQRQIAIADEYGLIDVWQTFATALSGAALSQLGLSEKGIESIQKGLAAVRGSTITGDLLCFMAEACLRAKRVEDGLRAANEALALAVECGDTLYEAENYRLKGELMLAGDLTKVVEAQACFEQAIEIARNQSAKSWELRATTSLARLLSTLGRHDEARQRLAAIYAWFTEGFDTADLKDAKALLHELSC
jgi:predicted ATPase